MIEFDSDSNRRLPVYLLLDTSGSMAGAPIQAVNQGVQLLLSELRNEPAALEMAWLCCLTFNTEPNVVLPLAEIGTASIPEFAAGGVTNMGRAIKLLLAKLSEDIRLNTPEQKGDYKPLVFIMTDANPTDLGTWRAAAQDLRERSGRQAANIIALGCGPSVNAEVLKELGGTVMLMQDVTPENIRSFFKWISQSVKTSSRTASRSSAAAEPTVNLPPVPSGIQLTL